MGKMSVSSEISCFLLMTSRAPVLISSSLVAKYAFFLSRRRASSLRSVSHFVSNFRSGKDNTGMCSIINIVTTLNCFFSLPLNILVHREGPLRFNKHWYGCTLQVFSNLTEFINPKLVKYSDGPTFAHILRLNDVKAVFVERESVASPLELTLQTFYSECQCFPWYPLKKLGNDILGAIQHSSPYIDFGR